uniref:Uncharacterized protein n=1 Tax=Tetranychus urticae TaxID=32264 RepID=T1K4N4_TETUR
MFFIHLFAFLVARLSSIFERAKSGSIVSWKWLQVDDDEDQGNININNSEKIIQLSINFSTKCFYTFFASVVQAFAILIK